MKFETSCVIMNSLRCRSLHPVVRKLTDDWLSSCPMSYSCCDWSASIAVSVVMSFLDCQFEVIVESQLVTNHY